MPPQVGLLEKNTAVKAAPKKTLDIGKEFLERAAKATVNEVSEKGNVANINLAQKLKKDIHAIPAKLEEKIQKARKTYKELKDKAPLSREALTKKLAAEKLSYDRTKVTTLLNGTFKYAGKERKAYIGRA